MSPLEHGGSAEENEPDSGVLDALQWIDNICMLLRQTNASEHDTSYPANDPVDIEELSVCLTSIARHIGNVPLRDRRLYALANTRVRAEFEKLADIIRRLPCLHAGARDPARRFFETLLDRLTNTHAASGTSFAITLPRHRRSREDILGYLRLLEPLLERLQIGPERIEFDASQGKILIRDVSELDRNDILATTQEIAGRFQRTLHPPETATPLHEEAGATEPAQPASELLLEPQIVADRIGAIAPWEIDRHTGALHWTLDFHGTFPDAAGQASIFVRQAQSLDPSRQHLTIRQSGTQVTLLISTGDMYTGVSEEDLRIAGAIMQHFSPHPWILECTRRQNPPVIG